MPTYYCGPGGNDGNSGLTWALRKLTLNGVEDVPVVAGDTAYVGPGVYREQLTVDVSGGAGTEITYIADVTGEHTDGVGGVVRITGSNDDQTATRSYCIYADAKHRRIFRGFSMDTPDVDCIHTDNGCDYWTIEDCTFQNGAGEGIDCRGAADHWTVRRCVLLITAGHGVSFYHDNDVDGQHTVQNLIVIGPHHQQSGVQFANIGNSLVTNCTFLVSSYGIRVTASPAVGQGNEAYNNIFSGCDTGMAAIAVTDITEDYNTFYGCNTLRVNVNAGANSVTYPPLFLPPILHAGFSQASGFQFPWWLASLSEWSQVAQRAGSNEPTTDLWGVERPAADSRKSWGACQFMDTERETTVTRGGSAASLAHHEPARSQMWVPVTNVSTTISVYVWRGPDYNSAILPRMVLKQPGAADRTTTDTGAPEQWNLLSDTFTPNADPPYVVVELASSHLRSTTSTSITSSSTSTTRTDTSTSSSMTTTTLYEVYWDDLDVS